MSWQSELNTIPLNLITSWSSLTSDRSNHRLAEAHCHVVLKSCDTLSLTSVLCFSYIFTHTHTHKQYGAHMFTCTIYSLSLFLFLLRAFTHGNTLVQGSLVYRNLHSGVTNNQSVMCKHTHTNFQPQTNISLHFLSPTLCRVGTQMCLYFRCEHVSDVPLWFNIFAAFFSPQRLEILHSMSTWTSSDSSLFVDTQHVRCQRVCADAAMYSLMSNLCCLLGRPPGRSRRENCAFKPKKSQKLGRHQFFYVQNPVSKFSTMGSVYFTFNSRCSVTFIHLFQVLHCTVSSDTKKFGENFSHSHWKASNSLRSLNTVRLCFKRLSLLCK